MAVPTGPAPTMTCSDMGIAFRIRDSNREHCSRLPTPACRRPAPFVKSSALSFDWRSRLVAEWRHARFLDPRPGPRRDARRDQGGGPSPPRHRRRQPVAARGRPRHGHGLVGDLPLLPEPRRPAHRADPRGVRRARRGGGGGRRRAPTGTTCAAAGTPCAGPPGTGRWPTPPSTRCSTAARCPGTPPPTTPSGRPSDPRCPGRHPARRPGRRAARPRRPTSCPSRSATDLAAIGADVCFPGLPEPLLARGMAGWTQLFGLISFELFGRLNRTIAAPGRVLRPPDRPDGRPDRPARAGLTGSEGGVSGTPARSTVSRKPPIVHPIHRIGAPANQARTTRIIAVSAPSGRTGSSTASTLPKSSSRCQAAANTAPAPSIDRTPVSPHQRRPPPRRTARWPATTVTRKPRVSASAAASSTSVWR